MTQFRKYLLASSIILAMGVSACGGGGYVSPTPTPPPAPPPPAPPPPPGVAIVTAATTSQQFATRGASYTSPPASYDNFKVSTPSLADSAQLDVRYDAASKTYEIQLPGDSAWQAIALAATYSDDSHLYRTGEPDHVGVSDHAPNLQYSALLDWFTDTTSGYSAIGMATPAGGVPTTGSASYAGSILGASSETHLDPWEAIWIPGLITGSIDLSFNFGSGALSGEISPTLYLDRSYTLPSLNFTNTVYSSGKTTFSGSFGTSLSGENSFSGLFTGPSAQEMIGNFAFPYKSPNGGATEQAAGAFVAQRP